MTPDKKAPLNEARKPEPKNTQQRCYGCSCWVRLDQAFCERCWEHDQYEQQRELESRCGDDAR